MKTSKIYFEKATLKHQDTIFRWLSLPHIQEFWDNSQEHKDDIFNFIHGRKQHYFYGTTQYWVGYIDEQPFCFILSDQLLKNQDLTDLHQENLSKSGNTISLDFGIGNTAFLGKGHAAPALKAFAEFYQNQIDPKADTFFIDPDTNNPKAFHVYEKAGFKRVGNYRMQGGVFKGQQTYLMVKKLFSKPQLVPATIADYPTVQNMARFYAYDMSRYCGFISNDWAFPKDGLYEAHDFKKYFEESNRQAFLVKIDGELSGFVLLNKIGTLPDPEWNIGEFFVIAKFQGKGIAKQVAYQIWEQFNGKWEVSVIPENENALAFWRKAITDFTDGHYVEEIKKIDYDKDQPKRYIFSFKTKKIDSMVDINFIQAEQPCNKKVRLKNEEIIEVEEISQDQAEALCRSITEDLPEYLGISSANEQYFKNIHSCKNLAAKIAGDYVGLISLNFPYANNINIYWMAVLKDHHCKGIGRKLIEQACQLTRKLNATTMTVETLALEESDENYLKTYKFYQSLGFKPLVKIKPEDYERNMVYMAKPLGNALDDLIYLEKDAREFGFDWPDEAMIIEQAVDECREIKEAIESQEVRQRIQEEIGDLLHTAVSLCIFAGFEVEETLVKVNAKFGNRMQAMKTLTHELGLETLQGQSVNFMLELWRKAKIMTAK